MRLVDIRDGVLELRWTWLPYWIGASPEAKQEIDRQLRDAALLNGISVDDPAELERLSRFVIRVVTRRFPIPGLREFLEATPD